MGIILPFLSGLTIRLLSWRMQGTGWLDELFSLHFASKSLAESWSLIILDIHPPFYHLLLTCWLSLWGDTLTVARLLSVLLGSLVVIVVWFLVREVSGRREASLAAWLVALSPLTIFHSGEARMYPLLLFLSSLSFLFFIRAVKNNFNLRTSLIWGLSTGVVLMTHITAVVPFLIFVFWGQLKLPKPIRLRLLITALISSLPFFVWLVFLLLNRGSELGGSWQFSSSFSSWLDYGLVPIKLVAHGATDLLLMFESFVLLIIFWFFLKNKNYRTQHPWVELSLLATAIPFVIFLFLGWTAIKYYFVVLPPLLVVTTVGLVHLFDRLNLIQRRLLVIGLVCFHLAVVVPSLINLVTLPRIKWDEAMQFIESHEQSGDKIFAEWFVSELPIKECYNGFLPVASGYAYDNNFSFDERLVRFAGNAVASQQMLKNMAEDISTAKRIFLVTGAFEPETNPVQAWFLDREWQVIDKWSDNSLSPTIVLFGQSN